MNTMTRVQAAPRTQTVLLELTQIVEQSGVRGLTVADLAKRLKCSRRLLYELAPSKDSLISRVVKEIYRQRRSDTLSRIEKFESPDERLKRYVDVIVQRNQPPHNQFFLDVAADPTLNRLRMDHVRQMLNILEEIIQDGVARRVYREVDTRVVAEYAFAMFTTFTRPDVYAERGVPFDQVVHEALDILMNGIIARPH